MRVDGVREDAFFAPGLSVFPAGATLHGLVEAQAARAPHAPALEDGGGVLSYADLDARAAALAARLRALGMGPERRVAVLLERGAAAVAAQLAVLKAGAAFVPLDPAYPDARLAYVLGDAGARVAVTRRALAGRLPAGVSAVCVDDPSSVDPEGAAAELPAVDPANAAYVVYTSGSTGAPKGVVVPHAAIAHHALAAARAYALGPGDRVLQFASPAFDVALEEVYPTLARGGTVVVRSERSADSLAGFLAFAAGAGLTVWNLPSPYWHELVGELERSGQALPPQLRLLVVGSEAASPAAFAAWRRIAGKDVAFRNAYGPTEATVTATLWEPPAAGAPDGAASLPIGAPLENVRACVLDERGISVGEGEPGELCIAGAGVARGYLGRAGETAWRFVPDPASPVPGARMYRTGDRVRLRGGALEFLGRVDRQVKVRGFRVEPEEIEAALRAHPGVREAAVVLREDAPGRARLVGYAAGDGVDPAELRAYLAGRLAAYMVPEALVMLAALPLTPGDKVDRRALPPPPLVRDGPGEAPREGAEAQVAAVWGEVLRVEGVARGDSFLALGGNSLLAAQVVSRLRHALGAEISVPALLEAGTVAGVARAVERAAAEPRGQGPHPVRRPLEGDHPVSPSQERAWFMCRLRPDSRAYQFHAVLRFEGALDAGVLRRAVEEIVRRHAIFRTAFPEVGGGPVQRVLPPFSIDLPQDDLRALPESECRARADRVIHAELERTFDMAAAPLVRWRLLRLAEDAWELVHVEHHLVHDGWSFNLFLAELLALYRAFAAGRPSPLAEPGLHFVDYAAWQREWVEGPEAAAQLAYWRGRLAGAPPLLELPTDHPRPPVQRFRGGIRRMELGADDAGAVRALGRAHDATLYATMVALFAALMQRWAGESDVCVGAAVANRRWRQVEDVIGMFVNTVVLRVGLDGDPTVAALLARARAAALEAYARQELPFDQVVQALAPERSLSYNPLHQVAFSFDDARMPEVDVPGVRVTVREGLSNGSAKFDLNVIVAPRGQASARFSDGWEAGGLTVLWEYDTDLFDAPTIDRMLAQYRRLLRAAAAAPHTPVSALPLLDHAEREQVVHAWTRAGALPADPIPLVHRAFEAAASSSPDAPALLHDGGTVRYGELERRATRVARGLRRLGVGPEVRVAVCARPGPGLVAAVLAVFKAGGAFVPLDPGYPAERLAYMLADCGASVLLADEAGAGLSVTPAVSVLRIDGEVDEDGAVVRGDGGGDDATDVSADQLAYVIYTSGSTGRPKGVGVAHGALANLLAATRGAFGVGPGDVMPALASYAFDIWLFEALMPLTAGAAVRLVPRERVPDARALARELADATLLHAVPALMRELAQAAREAPRLPRLRRVFVGGDRVPPGLLAEMRAAFPGAGAHVLYGPTEGTILASAHAVPGGGALEGHPIGRPLAGVRLYVCDPRGSPQPPGVPGELCIGGAGVARGYLGRPALTAGTFVPDPWSGTPGARLYRAGDRARWREDGTLEYRGRLDGQVKIRGHRIEPGEVEAALRRHPGVEECAVVAREDVPGERRLVAYVVGPADADALRAHLRHSLPEHMVPAAFVALERLPLTPNGKPDRRALPAPDLASTAGHAAPRTPVEEVIAGIWGEVLRLPRVGVHDPFFEIGGHSLLATRVLARIRDVLGVDPGIRGLFEAPTVAGLAERVEALRRGGVPALPPVTPEGDGDAPLSFAQERLWFLQRLHPDSPFYNIARALRLSGELHPAALERALGEVVRRHAVLRTAFPEVRNAPVQRVSPFAGFTLAVHDLAALDAETREAEVRRRAADDAARPFDLAAGPLFRATLLRLDDREHVLLLAVHHAVADGWSLELLFGELAALYPACRDGRRPPLPEPAVQYADFAAWQRRHLHGPALERALAYWTARLAGAPPVLELPTDRPRPAVQSYRGAAHPVAFPAELSTRLTELARREGATLYMVVLAAFSALLSKYGAGGDVVVGSPVAGRTRREVEGVIGCFANTLVMRTRLDGDPSFRQALARVRRHTLEAWDHQELPFERLVEALHPARTLSHAPLFQVMLAMAAPRELPDPVPGARATRIEVELPAARLELMLQLEGDAGGVRGVIEYATDLFDRRTIARVAGHLRRVLEAVADDAERPLSAIALLGPAERRRVLEGWNRPAAPLPAPACLHALFQAQAARTPHAVAAVHENERLTYAELNTRANRLAHHLRALGVGPERRVALCLPRGVGLVAAVLAVLKAGGAYVPLDPAYPPERLAFTLADAGVSALVTDTTLRQVVPVLSPVRVVEVDADAGRIARESGADPEGGALPANLAYLIYTSGSTGRPKGVAIEHRSAAAMLAWAARVHTPEEVSGVLLSTSLCFDLSVFELFLPLTQGGCVIVVENALALPRSAAAERVRLLNTVPSAGAALLATGGIPPTVRTVNLAGEPLRAELVDALYAAGVGRVRDLYGPSEETTYSTWTVRRAGGPETIGRPIDHTRAYVLDGWMRPAPVGVAGELYLGGPGVARGYLGRPALTAERFVPDPFSAGPGARLYRTGDRVRWSAAGTLHYLGRLDHQVKLRGYRIEPGEVEATLRRHPAVRDCVAVVREDAPGERRLVAYVAGDAQADELRAHLRRSLPAPMLPAAFVVMAALPLTPNGKVDRQALPAPEPPSAGDAYVAPRTPVERALAAIWAEVLNAGRVGVCDDFFALGGHSLLAVRVAS
ncbi:MAG TPA: amino acid adenylation domain-containing protein, partial [Longimicrobium sp.]|nr:amino acid adenylation domain-containing protein [Longimicrobium sp.]